MLVTPCCVGTARADRQPTREWGGKVSEKFLKINSILSVRGGRIITLVQLSTMSRESWNKSFITGEGYWGDLSGCLGNKGRDSTVHVERG